MPRGTDGRRDGGRATLAYECRRKVCAFDSKLKPKNLKSTERRSRSMLGGTYSQAATGPHRLPGMPRHPVASHPPAAGPLGCEPLRSQPEASLPVAGNQNASGHEASSRPRRDERSPSTRQSSRSGRAGRPVCEPFLSVFIAFFQSVSWLASRRVAQEK